MTLKNKDGTVYKLRSPHPVLSVQDKWENYFKYNFVHNKFVDIINQKVFVETPADISDQDQPIIIENHQENIIQKRDVNKIDFKCLVAKNIRVQDDVYGDFYNKIEYEKTIIFEGYILDIEDLSMEILSPIEIEKNSILTYDRRWWRVANNTKSEDNYIISLTISDYCPNF